MGRWPPSSFCRLSQLTSLDSPQCGVLTAGDIQGVCSFSSLQVQVSTQVPPCASHERSTLCNINLFARSGVSAGNTRDVAYDLNKPDLHPAALGAEAGEQER